MAPQSVSSDVPSTRPPKRSSCLLFPPHRARKRSYRAVFSTSKSAATYDDRVYAPGSSGELLWRVEAAIVRDLVGTMHHTHARLDYLDFACGTGRVLVHLESLVDSSTGIDVSPFMLDRAAAKVREARLLCTDISAPDDTVEDRYDLITAFRFLTNAEPELRHAALAGLRRRMKDDTSVLLVNTHGNPWSYRVLLLPYHWLRDRRRGRKLFGYMSRREARSLLADAGFVVQRIIGMGFVPEKVLPFVPHRLALWLERHLAGIPLLQACGLNQLYICRLQVATGMPSDKPGLPRRGGMSLHGRREAPPEKAHWASGHHRATGGGPPKPRVANVNAHTGAIVGVEHERAPDREATSIDRARSTRRRSSAP